MSDAAWLATHTRAVLHDCVVTVEGQKRPSHIESETVPIQMTMKVVELDYGPCLHWSLSVNIPLDLGEEWDIHPLKRCREVVEKFREGFDLAEEEECERSRIGAVGEILDDTPAVRALLAELCEAGKRKLYTTADCDHRARLIAAIETMWS